MVNRTEITSANLCRLLGITREALSGLVKRGIVRRGERKGSYDPASLGQRLSRSE